MIRQILRALVVWGVILGAMFYAAEYVESRGLWARMAAKIPRSIREGSIRSFGSSGRGFVGGGLRGGK